MCFVSTGVSFCDRMLYDGGIGCSFTTTAGSHTLSSQYQTASPGFRGFNALHFWHSKT